MTSKEKKLASAFLRLAADEFGNHGCNDMDEELWEGWSIEDRQNFVKESYEWNGDPENYNPDFIHLPDFSVMSFLADKLSEDIE